MAPPMNSSMVKPPPGEGLASLGPHIEAIQITMLSLSLLAIAGRLYGRRAARSVGADDYCIMLSGLCLIGSTTVVLIQVHHYNQGKHIWNIPGGLQRPSSKRQTAIGLLSRFQFAAGTGLVRISVLLFLCRLNPYTGLRRVIWLGIWTNIAFMIFCLLTVFVRCIPVSDGYYSVRQRPKGARCLPDKEIGIFSLAFGVFLNIWTWLLPALVVRKARVSRRKKAGLIAILCLGLVALISAIFRVPASYRLYITKDPYWDVAYINITSAIEFGIGIMAASAPGIKNAIQIARGKAAPRGPSTGGSSGRSGEPKINTFMMNRLRGTGGNAADKATESTVCLSTVDTPKNVPHTKLATTTSEREMDGYTFLNDP